MTRKIPLYKREKFPSLAKRGQGRFYREYVCSIMDSWVNMMTRIYLILFLACTTCIASGMPPAWGQTEFHGADSAFEREGITILWAILKGPTEESSWVYIKIISSSKSPFQIFSVEAGDPFSKEKEWVVKGERLGEENMIRGVRSSFKDKTARRILFYRSTEAFKKEEPDMAVYYLGVPDTSPEVLSEKEMEDYFKKALQRLKK
jgi:hypothetical protein